MTDTCSGAHYLDISSVGLSDIPLIIAVCHRAFSKVADNLDIFVVVEVKATVRSDLVVIENDEIPDCRVGRIAMRSRAN